MTIFDNPKNLARLLSSIKVDHAIRPLGPIETAKKIDEALIELNNDMSELEKRLPIKKDMIKRILKILKLPPEIHDIIIWGDLEKDTGEISFSAAMYLANLAHDDVLKVMDGVQKYSKPVTKEEIRMIVSLKTQNPEKPIEDCIVDVLNVSRVTVINHFLFISGIDNEIVKMLKNNANMQSTTINNIGLKILHKKFPKESVKSVNIRDDHIRISLTQLGNNHIKSYARDHDILKKDIINHIFKSGL